jgi:hypothetical protein
VSITGLSTTATGTVLTLSDSANTTTVNLIIDNQKEIRFRETTANGTNYVALKAPASVSADLTFTLPATDGTTGQVLSTNGSGVLSFITPSAGISWQSSVKTSGFTAVAGEGYFCNTTSAGFTVTLPATPTAGQQVAVVDYAGTFDTNTLTISPNGNKIEGATANLALTGEREGVLLVYIDSTQGWLATSGINEGTDALSPVPYSIDFLVIAGGGSAGAAGNNGGNGGGAGAGGYRTSTQSVSVGTVITVTVGDGAPTNTTAGGDVGTQGSNSSISGSGLTTITSAGGGGGGGGNTPVGTTGGSGGGRGATSGGSGSAGNTPSTSPSQGNNGGDGNGSTPNYGSGGGGGAGAVGGNGTSTVSGNGGNGTASSITGSSVTRAGGGGGGAFNFGTAGTGGSGGGGNGGSSNVSSGTAGTANTGGGGGGASSDGNTTTNGGAGGKGVVILSLPTASYSSTTTGSPTVTTSGSNTILQFNGSGSYTA